MVWGNMPVFAPGAKYVANIQFYTWYEVETPQVLSTDAYRERLENPTPLTRFCRA